MSQQQQRFAALVIGSLFILYFAYWLIEHHIIAFLGTVWAILVGLGKVLVSKVFWQKVPIVLGGWSKKTFIKVLLWHVPKVLFFPVFLMLLSPRCRRWLRMRVNHVSRVVAEHLDRVKNRFDHFFGVHGLLAFVVSVVVSVVIFIVSSVYLAFDVVAWFGAWGPLAKVYAFGLSWLTYMLSWFKYFLNGAVHNIPGLGKLWRLVGGWWQRSISVRFPKVARWHRRTVWRMLAQARRARLYSQGVRKETWQRLVERRKRAKARLERIKLLHRRKRK